MQIRWVHIKNYRSCRDVRIEFESLHALVGANNSGKSSIIRALDFLVNPSKTKIDEESFWNKDTSRQIWIEAVFDNLTAPEQADDQLAPYLKPDGTFHIARSAQWKELATVPQGGEADISQHYCKPMPRFEWLRESNINGANIVEWWNDRDSLVVNGVSFVDFLDTASRPNVGVWKEKAAEFVDQHLAEEHFEDEWIANPSGYAGVLKGKLPHFIFVPAVRDVADEAKVTKSNPFGQLLYAVIERVTQEQRNELKETLENVQNMLNRAGGDDRFESIIETENRLNELLREYMSCELEIEFQTPTLEILLTTPRLFADDGFRNIITNKGHGLQRATLFAILQCYSELVTGSGADKRRGLIFAVEEPELYMHPQAQRTIRRVFQDICNEGDQVIFSTHSALLLDVAYFDEIVRTEAIQEGDGEDKRVYTRVWQLPVQRMIDDLTARHHQAQPTPESMRELYANAYHPNRSEGFFAKKIILVEGATEHYSLPIYADALGYPLDGLNISVVDSGGKGPIDRLYRIFNELGIPCYMLFDYDKDSSDAETTRKSRELLEMVGESPDVPAQVLIKDQVACFPSKWEVDLAGEIPDYQNLAQEARTTLGYPGDSGKPLVARYIARSLTSQEPPFVPQSLQDIIGKAVEVEWEQTCLEC